MRENSHFNAQSREPSVRENSHFDPQYREPSVRENSHFDPQYREPQAKKHHSPIDKNGMEKKNRLKAVYFPVYDLVC